MADQINSVFELAQQHESDIQTWRKENISYWKKHNANRKERLTRLANFVHDQSLDREKLSNKALLKNKGEIMQFIESVFNKEESNAFKDVHDDWESSLTQLQAQLPDMVRVIQHVDRFNSIEGNVAMKIARFCKKMAYHASNIPIYFVNVFGSGKELKQWYQDVRLKSLFEHHFINALLAKANELDNKLMREFCLLNACIFDEEQHQKQSLQFVIDKWDRSSDAFIKDLETWFESQYPKFLYDLERCGTIDYSGKSTNSNALLRNKEKIIEKWDERSSGWFNNLIVLFDRWRTVLDLQQLQLRTSIAKDQFKAASQEWHGEIKKDCIDKIEEFISKTSEDFKSCKVADLDKLIVKTEYDIKKILIMDVGKNIENFLTKNTILRATHGLNHQLDSAISALMEHTVVARHESFDEPISSGQLETISNSELISFEIRPQIIEKLDKVKKLLMNSVSQLLIEFQDIHKLLNFTFSTVRVSNNDEDKNVDDTLDIIRSGLDKALDKLEDISTTVDELMVNCDDSVADALDGLVGSIDELKAVDSIFSLKMRIRSAKVSHQSKTLGNRVQNNLRLAYRVLGVLYGKIFNRIEVVRKRINLFLSPSQISHVPSRSISDFLSDSEKSIKDLPIMYRKLYALEPLHESSLFIGRTMEIDRIVDTYNNWAAGRVGSVLIEGEKWSGITSLINNLMNSGRFNSRILKHSFNKKINHTEELYERLSDLLQLDTPHSCDELITYLSKTEKKIIILEDLQNLYLRTMGGQKVLIKLLEIIAATHRNIFWVGTVTSMALNHLEKVMHISTYFSHHVGLLDLDDEQIRNLINTRNNISGLKMVFEPSLTDLSNKKYKSLSETDQQEYLKKKFFVELTRFAKSNITMALLFWLLSTKEVNEDVVIISTLKQLDLTFLNTLPIQKTFIFHALVIHDGLSHDQLAQVLSISELDAKLLLLNMEEDGMLRKSNELFMVNPLIYRSVVQLLKNRNFIN